MSTPVSALRRVPFFPHDEHSRRNSLSQPSPYTPFTGRRPVAPSTVYAASVISPQNAPSRTGSNNADSYAVLSFPKPESADAFARGGAAETALRASCLDIVSAVGDDALGLAREIISALEIQLSFASEFASDRSSHVSVRKDVARVAGVIRVERDTWTLVELAWRSGDIRCRDLCSRRANVAFIDDNSSRMPGMSVCRRIIEWLETTASQMLDASGGPQLMPLEDPAYKWSYTSSRLGAAPSIDYPILSGNENCLEEVENRAELRLSRELYRLVRAGRIEEAEMICRHVGQPWRAAVLAGGKDASSLSALGTKGGARQVWRSAAQAIAKTTTSSIPPWERALCGVLSGVLEPALAVSETYEDQLWARLSVLVDRAIERSLTRPREADDEDSSANAHGDVVMSGDVDSGDANANDDGSSLKEGKSNEESELQRHFADIDAEQILEAFRECSDAVEDAEPVSCVVLNKVRIVRSYLALGPTMSSVNARELCAALAKLAEEGLDNGVDWICRVAAHLALFVKKAALLDSSDEDAVSSYQVALHSHVRLMIDRELIEEDAVYNANKAPAVRPILYDLVARYLAEMESMDVIIAVYTEVMEMAIRGDLKQERILSSSIRSSQRQVHERRMLCLQCAGKYFGRHGEETLNNLIVSSVDRIWGDHLAHLSVLAQRGLPEQDRSGFETRSENTEISQDDELVIRSIEFLMFPSYPNYEEAVRRATCLARRFYLAGKESSARYVVEWFPSDAIAEIPPGRCEGELHELDCWRAYMDAVSRHNEWRVHFFSRRPMPLDENIRRAATAVPGEVSYEAQAAANLRLEAYVKEMEAYMRVATAARDAAVEALRVALLFEGGWMHYSKAQGVDADSDSQRDREIVAVRRIGVPQMTALLHHVLHESGLYAEAVELAALVADDGLALYEDFSKAELRAFLQRVNLSAVLMADKAVRDGTAVRPYTDFMFEEVRKQNE